MSNLNKRLAALEARRDQRILDLIRQFVTRAIELLSPEERKAYYDLLENKPSELGIAAGWKVDGDPAAKKIFTELHRLVMSRARANGYERSR